MKRINQKKKKGFTLIEIIAVLVIVAILAILIIPAINKYVKKGKDEYNTQLEQQLEIVGRDYYSANPKKLPTEVGKRDKPVWLAYLKSNNFTSEEFVDADGGKCIKSYVQVEKTDGGYDYTPCLVCDNYKSKNDSCKINTDLFFDDEGNFVEPESNAPTCDITLSDESGNWTNKDVKANIHYEADEENGRVIAGLSVDGKEVTEGVKVGQARGDTEYVITQSGYNKKVNAVVRDDLGFESDVCPSKHEVRIDKNAPVCMFSDPYKGDAKWESSSYPRKGETVYYDLTCSDSESKSIVTPLSTVVSRISISNLEYGKTSLKNVTGVDVSTASNGVVYKLKAVAGDTGPARLNLASGVVKDVAGNAADGAESPAVYVWNPTSGGGGGELPDIDTSVPSCTITMKKSDGSIYNEGDWSNKDVTVTATCTPTANIKYTPTQTVTNEGETTVYITASNIYNSSNSTTYTRTIRIDKTNPKCTVTMQKYKRDEGRWEEYENAHWTQYKVKVEYKCSDTGGSELNDDNTYMTTSSSSNRFEKYYTFQPENGTHTANIHAEDNAGNTKDIKKTIKMDVDPPTLSWSVSPSTSGKKLCLSDRITVTCKDSLSGVAGMSVGESAAGYYVNKDDLKNSAGGTGPATDSRTVTFKGTGARYVGAGCVDGAKNGTWYENEGYYILPKTRKETVDYVTSCSEGTGVTCKASEKLTTYTASEKKYSWEEINRETLSSKVTSKKSASSLCQTWCKSNGCSNALIGCKSRSANDTPGKTCLSSSGSVGSYPTCVVNKSNVSGYSNYSVTDTTYKLKGYCSETGIRGKTKTYTVCTSGYYRKESFTCTYN